MAPAERFFMRLAILPIMLVVAYLDTQSEGTWLLRVYEFLDVIWNVFLFLIGIASVLFLGVSASGRLKGAPGPKEWKRSGRKYDISPATFFVLLLYAAFYGYLYSSGANFGPLKPVELSGFSNLILFLVPIWFVICIQLYRLDTRHIET